MTMALSLNMSSAEHERLLSNWFSVKEYSAVYNEYRHTHTLNRLTPFSLCMCDRRAKSLERLQRLLTFMLQLKLKYILPGLFQQPIYREVSVHSLKYFISSPSYMKALPFPSFTLRNPRNADLSGFPVPLLYF